jgi:hypothetical protein
MIGILVRRREQTENEDDMSRQRATPAATLSAI